MGSGDDLINTLNRLLHSSGARVIGNDFLHMAQNSTNQPLGVSARGSGSNGTSGNSPNLGAILAGVADKFNGPGVKLGANLGSTIAQSLQPQDPMQTLYQQLLDQLTSNGSQPQAPNPADIMKQVQAAINPIYDQQAQQAEDQTGRYTKDVQGMYGALSKDYTEQAKVAQAQAKDAQDQVSQLYGQLRSNITGDYSRVSQDQAELFKSLGIESALPDVLGKENAPVQDALIAASQNQSQQQQRYTDIGNIDQTYYSEGAPNAILAGNEKSTGLLNDLQDYLQQVNAQRSSGIQSGYMDQLNQANSNYNQQQQTANSESARKQQMLWEMLQSQTNGKSATAQATPDSFLSSLPQETQQGVAQAFTQLQRSPEAVYGKVQDPRNPVPGTFVDTSPQWYMQQADQMYQNGQLDAATYQALQMYMQLYYKTGQ
jgi:hypothetical protein